MKPPYALFATLAAIAGLLTVARPVVASPDLVATNAGATLDLNTQTGIIIYDADGAGPYPATNFPAVTANTTATWTLGDIRIGNAITFTYNTTANNSSRGIKLIADGRGFTGNGDIVIEKPLNLNGVNGRGDGSNGGGRKFGATLHINEITPMRESTRHAIATYGTLIGAFAAKNGLPEGAIIDYADDNRILLDRPVPGTVLTVR